MVNVPDLTMLELFHGPLFSDGPRDLVNISDNLFTKKDQAGVEYFGFVLYREPLSDFDDSPWHQANRKREELLQQHPELSTFKWLKRSDSQVVQYVLNNAQARAQHGVYVKWFPMTHKNFITAGTGWFWEEVKMKSTLQPSS